MKDGYGIHINIRTDECKCIIERVEEASRDEIIERTRKARNIGFLRLLVDRLHAWNT